jgi:hypothetical protein
VACQYGSTNRRNGGDGGDAGSGDARGRGMILAFVTETVLCAAAVGVLFVVSWRDRYAPATAVLGVVLAPLLDLAILAVRGLL